MLKYFGSGLIKAGFIGAVLVTLIILVGLSPDRIVSLVSDVRYQALFSEAGGLATGNAVTARCQMWRCATAMLWSRS
jgi:phospholipid/cholesterol/gamma-HCH transport system substrate-binding protein